MVEWNKTPEDSSRVTRVIYKRPATLQDTQQAIKELADFQEKLAMVRFAIENHLFPPYVINSLQLELDEQMQHITKLFGFNSVDDLNYWVKNFMNKE